MTRKGALKLAKRNFMLGPMYKVRAVRKAGRCMFVIRNRKYGSSVLVGNAESWLQCLRQARCGYVREVR